MFTVIVKDFESDAAPSVTLIDALAVPASENPGARCRFPAAVPVPGEVVDTVAYVGPEASEKVRAWPSASVAESAWSAVAPSFAVMFAG